MTMNPNSGLLTRQSALSVDETVSKLQNILKIKGMTLFAVIDHSGAALKAGVRGALIPGNAARSRGAGV